MADTSIARSSAEERRKIRRRQIAKLKQQRRLVCLREVIYWLAALNAQGFRGPIDQDKAASIVLELRGSLCSGAFTVGFKSNVLILADDQPAARFTNSDVDAFRPDNEKRSRMYDEAEDFGLEDLRAVIERLWVPRDLLKKLFQQKAWPLPIWIEPPTTTKAARKKTKTGKYPLVAEYLGTRFPGRIPDPTHEPRKRLIAEAIAAIPKLGGKLDEETMKKAIRLHNENI